MKTVGLTAAQLAFRKSGIGGSEIAALADLNPWMTPIDVYLEKTGRRDVQPNAAMEWGLRLEGPILAKYSDDHGATVLTARQVWPLSIDGTLVHPEHGIAIASPDGVVIREGRPVHLVEAKAPGFRMADEYEDAAPLYYVCQTQWEMFVTGVHSATLAVLIGGQDYREFEIPYDAELCEMLLDAAKRFWRDHVVPNRAPPVDGSESSSKYLRQRFAKNNGRMLPAAPVGAYDLAIQYKAAAASMSEAEARKDYAGNKLRALIGDADGFDAPGLKCTWKSQQGTPAWKSIAEEAGATPDLIAKHTPTQRVIRVTVADSILKGAAS